MAVYKIYPIADTTLVSEYNNMNTGIDPILDLSKSPSVYYPIHSTAARPIIKFSQSDIQEVMSTYVGTGSYKAILKAYIADATGIPTDLTVEVKALAEDFDMGTGRYGATPINTTGASWVYKRSNQTQPWQTASYSAGTTGYYAAENPGGGTWYTGSIVTQSFGVYNDKDINVDVTTIVNRYNSGSYNNYGFILTNAQSIEFDADYTYTLNYFSRDTNTIYSPYLEFRWDDSVYQPSSETNICSNGNITLTLQNNVSNYNVDSVARFRINVRDRFPVRTFTTGSLYTVQKYLPETSYYSIVDYKTKDVVIEFDTQYTKISADSKGNYFDIHMNGLQPLRYYKVVIKSLIGGEVLLFDQDYIFKTE